MRIFWRHRPTGRTERSATVSVTYASAQINLAWPMLHVGQGVLTQTQRVNAPAGSTHTPVREAMSARGYQRGLRVVGRLPAAVTANGGATHRPYISGCRTNLGQSSSAARSRTDTLDKCSRYRGRVGPRALLCDSHRWPGDAVARANRHTEDPEALAEAVARSGSTAAHTQSPAIMPRGRSAGRLFCGPA